MPLAIGSRPVTRGPYLSPTQRRLRAVGSMTDGVAELVRRVVHQLHRCRIADQSDGYVLVDDRGDVYVLSDGAAATEPVVAAHVGWLIGRYACGDAEVWPVAPQIAEDLEMRFEELSHGTTNGTAP